MPLSIDALKDGDFARLTEAANKDDHFLTLPTHSINREGEIVGAVSFLSMPILGIWLDSQKIKVRGTLQIQKALESTLKQKGYKMYFVPCEKNSPLHPYMFPLGYSYHQSVDLFVKILD